MKALINGRRTSGIPGHENILGNGLAAGAAAADVRAGAAAAPGAAAAAPRAGGPKWKPRTKPPPRTNFDDF